MPRTRVLLLAPLCVLIFTCRAAQAATPGEPPRDKDLKRAEAVLAKLQRLEAASADAADARRFRSAVGELYPGLFVSVSELREGGVKTDLATAASLYEAALRASASTPDCARELRDSYLRLCREYANNDRARLLFAKARLHTRWAEAALRHGRGDRDPETLAALEQLRAERDVDLRLARRALSALKALAENSGPPSESYDADPMPDGLGDDGRAFAAPTDAELSEALDGVDLLLASLPRGHVHQLLRNARNHLRDGLSWRLKARPRRSLTVSVNSLDAPDPLRRIHLDADTAARTALHNWRGARNFVRRAEEAIQNQ